MLFHMIFGLFLDSNLAACDFELVQTGSTKASKAVCKWPGMVSKTDARAAHWVQLDPMSRAKACKIHTLNIDINHIMVQSFLNYWVSKDGSQSEITPLTTSKLEPDCSWKLFNSYMSEAQWVS